MHIFKRIGVGVASAMIITLTPMAAFADCSGCFGGCLDMYGEDNSESGYYKLAQCFGACTDDQGFPCMGTID